MHTISSYCGNRPTNKQTNKHTHIHTHKHTDTTDYTTIRIHCAAASLLRSVTKSFTYVQELQQLVASQQTAYERLESQEMHCNYHLQQQLQFIQTIHCVCVRPHATLAPSTVWSIDHALKSRYLGGWRPDTRFSFHLGYSVWLWFRLNTWFQFGHRLLLNIWGQI